ncbi:unnamed protein product [Fusarium fujikuroi]|uniref:Uncharacterized protein n=1 Tax=Fusarium fujikuroi TaxID=5127 RepID=A0A9Q9RNI5_FUSFU|nr:unnamed protein product [Fusarium fujikuroi]
MNLGRIKLTPMAIARVSAYCDLHPLKRSCFAVPVSDPSHLEPFFGNIALPEPVLNQLSWLESRHLLSPNGAIIVAGISCLGIGFIDILRPVAHLR